MHAMLTRQRERALDEIVQCPLKLCLASGLRHARDADGDGVGLTHGAALRKVVSAGITLSGASSMSQCPEPATTWPCTFVATSLACSMRKLPLAFSPVSTSTGIGNGVLLNSAKSFASRSKL